MGFGKYVSVFVIAAVFVGVLTSSSASPENGKHIKDSESKVELSFTAEESELLSRFTQALSGGKVEELTKCCAQKSHFASLDNRLLRTPAELVALYSVKEDDKSRMLKSISFKPLKLVSRSELSSGVRMLRVNVEETYTFKRGVPQSFSPLWTVVITKSGGTWVIQELDMSPSISSNLVLARTETQMRQSLVVVALFSFIGGVLTVFVLSKFFGGGDTSNDDWSQNANLED